MMNIAIIGQKAFRASLILISAAALAGCAGDMRDLGREPEMTSVGSGIAQAKAPQVMSCFQMTGDADYILRVSAASAGAYEAIHTDILSRLPGVARIHSSFAMRNVLQQRPARRGKA